MIPIEKNIIVTDEQGNILESTYPRRAKGLVKNGRARYIDENTICLACPPKNLEEIMSENNKNTSVTEPEEVTSNINNNVTEVNEAISHPEEKLSMNYILEQIEKIAAQTEYLNSAIAQLGDISIECDNDAYTAQSEAIRDIVCSRETTNHQLLRFYEKVYDNLREAECIKEKNDNNNIINNFEAITQWAKSLKRDEFSPETWEVIQNSIRAQLCRNF